MIAEFGADKARLKELKRKQLAQVVTEAKEQGPLETVEKWGAVGTE